MLAYVDESGCTGMRLDAGASPFFTVTAVVFEDRQQADRCYARIDSLRRTLKVAKEFHFTKLSHNNRVAFYKAVDPFGFRYVSVAFDKSKMCTEGIVLSVPFIQYPVKAIFAAIAPKMSRSTIVIDKTGSSTFRKQLARELKRDLNEQFGREVVHKIKELDSHKHCLLQLADMVCGAVARSLNSGKQSPSGYRDLIRSHEHLVTVWPGA
jgi:hypothetical protein